MRDRWTVDREPHVDIQLIFCGVLVKLLEEVFFGTIWHHLGQSF